MTTTDLGSQQTGYFKTLDGLRGIAILLVIVWHYIACLLVTDSTITSLVRSLLASTWSGVDLFFVLSGFLLGRILLLNVNSKNYYSTFYVRRILRIFPLYYLFLITYMLGKRAGLFFPQYFEQEIPLWAYLVHIQNFFMTKSFGDPNLGVTWSLAIEEQFYLILPLMISLSRQYLKYILIAGIITAPIVRYLIGGTSAYVLLPARIDSLLFGVSIANLFVSNKLKWGLNHTKVLYYFVFTLLVLIALLSIFTDWNKTGGVWNHTVYAILYSIILIIALGNAGKFVKKILESKFLTYVGKISYGLYLLHMPIILAVFYLLAGYSPRLRSIYDLLIILCSFLICMIILTVSNVFFETPVRNLGKKFKYN